MPERFGNPLSLDALCTTLPQLQAQGVYIDCGDCPDRADPVVFRDPGLEAAVRDALETLHGAPPPQTLHLCDLRGLTELDAVDRFIHDLAGIEWCRDLVSLDLRGNAVWDLEPVAGLHGLASLDLANNQLWDLRPLGGLARLESLDVSGNGLQDLYGLQGLTALRTLDAHGNRIRWLDALEHTPALETADLSGNHIRDLDPLAALPALSAVNLACNRIGTLAGLVPSVRLDAGQPMTIDVRGNALALPAYTDDIPALETAGATVHADAPNYPTQSIECQPDCRPTFTVTVMVWPLNVGEVSGFAYYGGQLHRFDPGAALTFEEVPAGTPITITAHEDPVPGTGDFTEWNGPPIGGNANKTVTFRAWQDTLIWAHFPIGFRNVTWNPEQIAGVDFESTNGRIEQRPLTRAELDAMDLSPRHAGIRVQGPYGALVTGEAACVDESHRIRWGAGVLHANAATHRGARATLALHAGNVRVSASASAGPWPQYRVSACVAPKREAGCITGASGQSTVTSTGGFVANAVVAYRESTITFAATAHDGYAFSRWEGVYRDQSAPDGQRVVPYPGAGGAVKWYNLDGTGGVQGSTLAVSDAMITVRYNEDDIAQHGVPRLRAVFHETPYYVLNVVIDAEDATTHAPACLGRVHWNPARARYPAGTHVEVAATPYEDCCYAFSHWEGEGNDQNGVPIEGNANQTLRIVMDDDREVVAVFGSMPCPEELVQNPEDGCGIPSWPDNPYAVCGSFPDGHTPARIDPATIPNLYGAVIAYEYPDAAGWWFVETVTSGNEEDGWSRCQNADPWVNVVVAQFGQDCANIHDRILNNNGNLLEYGVLPCSNTTTQTIYLSPKKFISPEGFTGPEDEYVGSSGGPCCAYNHTHKIVVIEGEEDYLILTTFDGEHSGFHNTKCYYDPEPAKLP